MNWTINYFSERVQKEISEWPVGIYADYLRLVGLMEEHRAGRAFYCTMVERQIVILHSFIKKTQETPPLELKTARKRLKEVKRG